MKNNMMNKMPNSLPNNIQNESTGRLKQCGAITCIHNIDGYCNMEKCEMHERILKQEY